MAIEIRRATSTDAEDIVALLEGFYPGVADHWRKLFKPRPWQIKDDFPGFVVIDAEKIVGFLGLVFSEHPHPTTHEPIRIGNFTTWYIDPHYRQYTMALLLKVLELPNVTWTNLTPSAFAYALLKKLDFQDLQETQTLVLPLPHLSLPHNKTKIIINPQPQLLTTKERTIYDQHHSLCCQQILLTQGDERCYLVLIKTQYKRVPLAKIYYISNPEFLRHTLSSIRMRLCWQLKVAYLIFEGNPLGMKPKLLGSFIKKLAPPRLFKSETLTREHIPLLQSELFILGI